MHNINNNKTITIGREEDYLIEKKYSDEGDYPHQSMLKSRKKEDHLLPKIKFKKGNFRSPLHTERVAPAITEEMAMKKKKGLTMKSLSSPQYIKIDHPSKFIKDRNAHQSTPNCGRVACKICNSYPLLKKSL